MIESFIDRENQIFEILQKFIKESLDFVLIGGYADISIRESDKEKFISLLKKNNFVRTVKKDMPYVNFEQFTRKNELAVTVDLLIGGVASRTTNAIWDFDFIFNHSQIKKIKGIENEINARIPEKELLISTKLHSARLTDCRDIVALASEINKNKIVEYANRGDKKRFKLCLEKVKSTIENKNFIDAFKGVFSAEAVPEKNVHNVKDTLQKCKKHF